MAEELKRQYDLVVLKLGLALPSGERTHVGIHCEIEAKVAGELTTLARCDLTPDDFGIPSRLDPRQTRYRGYDFKVPTELVQWLQRTLAETELAGRPLWLHLVCPYGYLGVVPWERLLVPRLQIPILRLPDFIVPPPAEVRTTLDVVLCCSMPAAKESFEAVDQMAQMVHYIRDAAPRPRVTVHVFADAEFYGTLQLMFSGRGWLDAGVRLYQPSDAYSVPDPSSRITDPGVGLVSPWLLWMRDALKGRSVDVVHFLCHGYFANDRGAIAFSQTPTRNEDSRIARFVGTGELDTFVTQVGAWSCAFSSPRKNFSEMGLRMLADTLAQLRPLSILHHETELDLEGQVLRDTYRFLYATDPMSPPVSPAAFFYCQPYRVLPLDALIDLTAPPADVGFPVTASINVEELSDETGAIPNWLAAGERFVEQQHLDLKRGVDLNPSGVSRSTMQTVNSTLKHMQEILARSARTRKGDMS
jgi:hypothetical protein